MTPRLPTVWHRPVESELIRRLRDEVVVAEKQLTADRLVLQAAVYVCQFDETILEMRTERLANALTFKEN